MSMKIAFVGFRHGHIYALYKMAAACPSVEIVACVERDATAREKAAQKLGTKITDTPYEQVLAGEADIICTGAAYGERGGIIIEAMKNGKHVLCDKPVCTRRAELLEIERLCNERGTRLGCMLDLRYLGAARLTKELLERGTLGALRILSFTGQHCIDYAHRPAWYFEEEMHGGTVNDLAIHGVDLVRYMTGLSITQVDGMRQWNAYATKHPDFKDSATFMARLEGGAELMADVSYSAPSQVFSMPTYWNFKLWCERGMLTFHLTDPHVTLYMEGEKTPTVLEVPFVEDTCLSDLLAEIAAGSDTLTKSILASTREVLSLQEVADRG